MRRGLPAAGGAALAAMLPVAACHVTAQPPDPARMAAETGRLEQTLPLLEDLGVTGFMAEVGCAWIIYARVDAAWWFVSSLDG